jgi:hypothetical protein
MITFYLTSYIDRRISDCPKTRPKVNFDSVTLTRYYV